MGKSHCLIGKSLLSKYKNFKDIVKTKSVGTKLHRPCNDSDEHEQPQPNVPKTYPTRLHGEAHIMINTRSSVNYIHFVNGR